MNSAHTQIDPGLAAAILAIEAESNATARDVLPGLVAYLTTVPLVTGEQVTQVTGRSAAGDGVGGRFVKVATTPHVSVQAANARAAGLRVYPQCTYVMGGSPAANRIAYFDIITLDAPTDAQDYIWTYFVCG